MLQFIISTIINVLILDEILIFQINVSYCKIRIKIILAHFVKINLKKDNVNTSSSVGSDVKIHNSVSETSVNPEQNVGEQDSEGQQKNMPKEPNVVGNSTRQPFVGSNTLDTNGMNSHGMLRLFFFHFKYFSKAYK